MCNDYVQRWVHFRVRLEVSGDVCTEYLDVGQLKRLTLLCRSSECLHVIGQDRKCFKNIRYHVIGAYLQRVHIYIDAFVGPAAAAFLHASPVLEWGGDQGVWRYHGQCVVPVAHLDCVQGDLFHISVCTSVRHLDPVSDLYHIVLGQLYAGYESQYAVLEYQHQHCRRGTESGEQHGRGLVYEDCNYDYGSYEV